MQNDQSYNRVNGLTNNSKKLIIKNNPFKIKLKNHQRALLYKILTIDDQYSKSSLPFGIMSDKPGAGKTFVVLALIYYTKIFGSKGINIIVVPHNLYGQWIDALKKFIGDILTYKCLTDYNDIIKLFVDTSLLSEFDILITTPLYYDVLATTVNSMKIVVRRLFFDEADTMKKLLVNALKSEMTWFISASIHSIFENSGLQTKIGVYDLALAELLKNECYCDSNYVDENIKLPKPNEEIFLCYDYYIDNVLNKYLDETNLKYINSHNYLYIKNECGGENVKNSREIVKYLYKNIRKIIDECDIVLKELQKDKTESKAKINNKNKREEYTLKFGILKNLINSNNLCIECMKFIEKNTYLSECNDNMCVDCYNKEKNLIKCLACNKNHKKDSYAEKEIIVSIKKKEYLNKCENNKFKILEKILEVCDNKIILFSQYKGLNNYIQKYTFENRIRYEELNGGNIKEIDKILNNFKNDSSIKILLIDDAYFGVGLNLEYTTDIIFFHKCDSKIKNQLIGRAQRYGRKSRLNIWALFYSNEK